MKNCTKSSMSTAEIRSASMSLRVFRSLMVTAAMASAAATSSAQIVTNGDFETGSFSGWSQSGVIGIASSTNYFLAYGPFQSGQHAVAFGAGDGPAGGTLRQTINTIAGQQYEISFDYGKFQAVSPASQFQSINLALVDTTSQQIILNNTINDASGASNPSGQLFSPYAYRFSAIGTSTTISFTNVSLGSSSTDGILDNVGVTAVPEPETGLLAAAGLLFLLVQRKRRTSGTLNAV